MTVKMSLITLLYVGVTFMLWKSLKGRETTADERVAIGLLYGILSIFSTHFGVDYGEMLLNVRDLGPMTAGLFFNPLSGIIAGLIGGAERYIAGCYFGVGAYTMVACSVSTVLAGFLSALLSVYLFKGKKPAVAYSFFMGAVIEVFHMYVVFVTHRGDIDRAFYVVRVCSIPMILFSGIGLALTSLVLKVHDGEWKNHLRSVSKDQVPVSSRFQMWLLGVTVAVLLVNFGFAFSMQTDSAMQYAKRNLKAVSTDIGNSVVRIYDHNGNVRDYSHNVWSSGTFAVLDDQGELIAGTYYDRYINDEILEMISSHKPNVFFTSNVFGSDSLCYIRIVDDRFRVFVQLPMDEVYKQRNIQGYETMLADILLFTVIYILISMLVQSIVVRNLLRVNESLNKITEGDLNEKVEVYNSLEFASLSNDINLTVDVLKGYIAAAEKRIEQELLLAHNIQDSALPKNFTFNRKGFEIYATMDPAREVGGDFYDFFFVDQGRMAMIIADVSGKGIPAALFMMRSKTAIRGLAETGDSLEEIFGKVGNLLCEGNEINMFVTVWMGIIDLETGDMKCLNAGHEYPVVMRNGGEFELLKDRHCPPLGVMEDLVYKSYEMHLEPGDCLYVYTDGIPEAINTKEEQYGTERMISTLNENKDLPVEELLKAVKADQDKFVGEADQFDDITMLGFRYNGQQ